jgi:NADP-dependent 3-hydroxy acid dehydrogenase YdfG
VSLDLAGRVVAITGASSGIGRATALACAQSGAAVGLAARRSDRIEALAAEIAAAGGQAHVAVNELLVRPATQLV